MATSSSFDKEFVVTDPDAVLKLREELNPEYYRGARAMFDYFMGRAANCFHADPEINKQCEREAELIRDLAEDALTEISPRDAVTWKDLKVAQARIQELENLNAQKNRSEVKLASWIGEGLAKARIQELEAQVDRLREYVAENYRKGRCDQAMAEGKKLLAEIPSSNAAQENQP